VSFEKLTGTQLPTPEAEAALVAAIRYLRPKARHQPTPRTLTGTVSALPAEDIGSALWVAVDGRHYALADVATYSATCYAVQRGRATGELISMLKRVIPVGTRVTGVLVDRSAVLLGTTADPAASVNMAMLRSGWAGMDDHAQDWQTFDWFPEARAAHIAAVAALHAGQTTRAEPRRSARPRSTRPRSKSRNDCSVNTASRPNSRSGNKPQLANWTRQRGAASSACRRTTSVSLAVTLPRSWRIPTARSAKTPTIRTRR
jgi:hypothetical protein